MAKVRLHASVPVAPLRVNATLPLLVRLEQLVQHEKKVRDPANITELHDMRMAVKWLRYTLEIFADAVEDSDETLRILKYLQHVLGKIHDADILIPVLEEDICREYSTPGVQTVFNCVRKERAVLFDEFTSVWGKALDDRVPIRLWNAALNASAPEGAPAHESQPKDRLLPSKRVRRTDMTIALLRLVPYAAVKASPEVSRRLLATLGDLESSAIDPESDEQEWRKTAGLLCDLICGRPIEAQANNRRNSSGEPERTNASSTG